MLVVPETKGRTLEEMDEIFGEVGFAQADLAIKARIEREIGLTALLGDDDRVASIAGPGKENKYHESPSEELVEKTS